MYLKVNNFQGVYFIFHMSMYFNWVLSLKFLYCLRIIFFNRQRFVFRKTCQSPIMLKYILILEFRLFVSERIQFEYYYKIVFLLSFWPQVTLIYSILVYQLTDLLSCYHIIMLKKWICYFCQNCFYLICINLHFWTPCRELAALIL